MYEFASFNTILKHILNKNRYSFKSSNDEPTPLSCIEEMVKKLPGSFWKENIKILDPVWIGRKKPEQAMEQLQLLWQKHLDKG